MSWTRARIALALAALSLCAAPGIANAAEAKPSVAGGKPASLADFGFTVAIRPSRESSSKRSRVRAAGTTS